MAGAQTLPARDTYVESRAPLMKSRWEKRLGRPLEIQTEYLVLGPDGKRYHADIVLQDPSNGVPLVVFEVKSPGKTAQQTESNLRRILDSQRYFESWGGKRPKVVLLVPGSEKGEAARIKRALNARGVQVEVV